MKKLCMILSGVASLVVATSSFAAAMTSGDVCTGLATAGNGTVVTGDQTTFVLNDFTPKCSGNVFLSFQQDQIAVGVGAASRKGRSQFGGNTNGGAVKNIANCTSTTTGCVQTDASGPAAAQLTAAHSS